MDKIITGKKRYNQEISEDIYNKYFKLLQYFKKPKFHLFNKQKNEIEQNEVINQYFINQNLNPNISYIINNEKKMIIQYHKNKFIFSVNYLFESIYFPKIEIKSILSTNKKKDIILYINSINENFNIIISGFKITKIYCPSNSLFNLLSSIKLDSKILLLSNKFIKTENLICITPKLIHNINSECEFIICRINESLIKSYDKISF
jgi:hypothetical protein